ncbi:MAG: hypothetical protein NTW21_10830 [Verrucomicrobia bacterium]|nr:hypothetical protein [Verrucomicrobiota bacterium]
MLGDESAPAAIVFSYRHVLRIPVGELDQFVRAKPRQRLPHVLTKDETHRVIQHRPTAATPPPTVAADGPGKNLNSISEPAPIVVNRIPDYSSDT